MKAAVFNHYGSADFIKIEEIEKPKIQDDEILVRIYAASINEWDWGVLHGTPLINRLSTGIIKPKKSQLGADVAGVVEAVGKAVKQFQVGDAVFGDICTSDNGKIPEYRGGAFAEYVCVRENVLQRIPVFMTFEQAASLPQAGALAIQGLRKGKLNLNNKALGHKVLINGAGGGAGLLAIQIAKSTGAEVTAVDNTAKLERMHSLGADHVIDFTHHDFTKMGLRYDLILDIMGYHSIFDYRRVLNPNGRYIMLGGGSKYTFQVILMGPLFSLFGDKQMSILFLKPNKDLDILVGLIESGMVTPVIDRTFPLSETADAFRYYSEGRFSGKIVITMTDTT